MPVLGPVESSSAKLVLDPIEERYRVISYADDIKPAVTNLAEFSIINNAAALFESASGCCLHRDPASEKCKVLLLGKWKNTLKQADLPGDCQYIKIADHLDMLGIQLKSSWTQTRKTNGDSLQLRVANLINTWKSGKFMPLTMRPWSINCYALSKIWFKCGSVDLRVCDINSIQSSIKSWLYSDLKEKPAEIILHRPPMHGGLGLVSLKYKAMAILIRNFMETAAHPKYRKNLLHSVLYRYHILGDDTVSDPGFLPYYPQSFFETIKEVQRFSTLNPVTMSICQWTRFLTERYLTMEEHQGVLTYIPCRVEIATPSCNWDVSWRLSRLYGLNGELASFNFKLLHCLLVTNQRLNRFNRNTSPTCNLCDFPGEEDLMHCLINCDFNDQVGNRLTEIIRTIQPNLSPEAILRLDFDITEEKELAATFFTSSCLCEIWKKRQKKERILLYDIRSTLEAQCLILRKTRFQNEADEIIELVSQL